MDYLCADDLFAESTVQVIPSSYIANDVLLASRYAFVL